MASARYAFVNGEIVDFEHANVHIASAGFKFGAGVFEGIRGYWNPDESQMYLFRIREHMQRLAFSQRFMRFEGAIDVDYVMDRIVELIRANDFKETIHIMATVYASGHGGPGVRGPVDLAITTTPGVGPGLAERGARVQVSSWRRISDMAMPPRVKCNANYQNGRLALMQAVDDGYDTALLLNMQGKVCEGPGMCFFMLRDGQILTPTVTSDVLESITRDTVICLGRQELGFPVLEREVDRSELMAADEAFFCGTAWEITPIVNIDGIAVGDGEVGEVVRRLRQTYLDIATGRSASHEQWRHPVY